MPAQPKNTVPKTVHLDPELIEAVEVLLPKNKRTRKGPKTFSAVADIALREWLVAQQAPFIQHREIKPKGNHLK